jgi:hypothetical protein
VSADRSTENGWLRKIEKAAADNKPADTYLAWVVRQILREAWKDGWERGYEDCREDTEQAQRAAKKAAAAGAEAVQR